MIRWKVRISSASFNNTIFIHNTQTHIGTTYIAISTVAHSLGSCIHTSDTHTSEGKQIVNQQIPCYAETQAFRTDKYIFISIFRRSILIPLCCWPPLSSGKWRFVSLRFSLQRYMSVKNICEYRAIQITSTAQQNRLQSIAHSHPDSVLFESFQRWAFYFGTRLHKTQYIIQCSKEMPSI